MVDFVDNHLYEKQVFSLYDEKLGLFNSPFYLRNSKEAIRTITDMISVGNDSMLVRHSEDFKLYRIAAFDETRGIFRSLDVPEFVCNVFDIVSSINLKRASSSVGSETLNISDTSESLDIDDAPVSVKECSDV